MGDLFHFSEDPSIERFAPHVPRTNPTQPPAVWAIDGAHAPLYWFPRDCPRVTAWVRERVEIGEFRSTLCTTASRVHAIEHGWLDRMRTTQLFRYTFDSTQFAPWPEASGQWISRDPVVPIAVEPVGDLLAAHAAESVELRFVPSLWPLFDLVQSGSWDFGIVRMHNAEPRR